MRRFIWFAYHNEHAHRISDCISGYEPGIQKIEKRKTVLLEYSQIDVLQKDGPLPGADLLISGVIPEFQRTGVVGGIYLKLTDSMREAWA